MVFNRLGIPSDGCIFDGLPKIPSSYGALQSMAAKADDEPTSIAEAIRIFSDRRTADRYVAELRWPDGRVHCPRCGHESQRRLPSNRRIWRCDSCRRELSLKAGTIFENSPIGWDQWLPVVWLIAHDEQDIPLRHVARMLGASRRTVRFMLHRIRSVMETTIFQDLDGP